MAKDFLLKVDTIKGESKQDGHVDEIELDSLSWGVVNSGSFASGGGGGAGKASFQDLHFSTGVGGHSPLVAKACATGQHITKATLVVRKQGTKAQEFYKVLIEDILVSSYQSGAAGDGIPVDQFSLNYAKIEFDYSKQKADGSLEAPIIFKYDLKAGKAP